jgi:hypothetical protein
MSRIEYQSGQEPQMREPWACLENWHEKPFGLGCGSSSRVPA